jgi:hypothetical protein
VKINILGKPYQIVEIDPASAPDFCGTNNRDAQTITVVKLLGPDARKDTLLHETAHLVSDELCLGLTEAQVGALACGLYSAGCRVKVEK